MDAANVALIHRAIAFNSNFHKLYLLEPENPDVNSYARFSKITEAKNTLILSNVRVCMGECMGVCLVFGRMVRLRMIMML